MYFGELVGVGYGLAIAVEGEASEVVRWKLMSVFGLGLEGASVGQHFLKIIEIPLIINAIRTLSSIPDNT